MVLRYDTPDEHRRFLRFKDGTGGFLVAVAALVAIAALFFGIGAVVVGDTFGIVFCGGYLAGFLALAVWVARRDAAVERWEIPVRIGGALIAAAHADYQQLTPDGRAQAAPLLDAMYRLAAVELTDGSGAEAEVQERMQRRWLALRGLVEAEDRMRLHAARFTLDDDDDLTQWELWRQATAEVEKTLGEADYVPPLPDPGRGERRRRRG